MKKIVLITGTDTGVGKTLLSGLLLYHLRFQGVFALAMKPVATGSRRDAHFLSAIQGHSVPLDWVNPCFFREALAPCVAARRQQSRLNRQRIIRAIARLHSRCECLLIEGAGGLLTPLGKEVTLVDLVPARLFPRSCCRVIVAARNRLGVINHIMLTLSRLKQEGITDWKVVLMGTKQRNLATVTNPGSIAQLIGYKRFYHIKFLGSGVRSMEHLREAHKKVKKTLARILEDQ